MYRETVSGSDGTFIATGIVPGKYQVVAELQGFKKFDRRDLALEVGKTATIEVTLEVGAVSETVTVKSESPLVDVTSKEIGGNITSETLVQLPSVNGNFIGFIGLLPGIVPSISTESFGSDAISVNGQDPRNNNYSVDGGNNNDDVIGQRAGMQARPVCVQHGLNSGVPGHHQSVRRRVRADVRRCGQRCDEVGQQCPPRHRLRLLPGRQPDDEGLPRKTA